MFLSRVCMGRYSELEKSINRKREPSSISSSNNDAKVYDSILAKQENYQEFIVYDRKQTYPEFLITFKRTHKQ